MRRLSAFAWRSLTARALRSVLTALGIALGVAVLFAALATNHAVDSAVDDTVSAMLGSADLRVAAFTESGLTPTTVAAIGSTSGVLVAAPEMERRTYLQPGPGSVSSGLRPPVTVLGVDPRLDPQLHPDDVIEGTQLVPGAPGAVISERLARDDGLGVGDELTLGSFVDPAQSTVRITGIAAGNGRLPGGDGRLIMIPLDLARTLFAIEGVSRVDVDVAPGVTAAQVTAEIEGRIRNQPYTIAGPAELAAALRGATADFQATTGLIAAVALFVGAFLIYNTLSMTLAERIREIALLRAAGATRRQVAWLVVLQAIVLGLAGSVLGVVIGQLIAAWLTAAIAGQAGAVGGVVPAGPSLAPLPIVLAIGVGLLVTIAAALEPAWRATRISPIDSLRRHRDAAPVAGARLAWLGGVFLVVGVVGLLLWPGDRAAAGLLRSFGVYALLLLVTMLSPIILPALGRAAGLPFAAVLRAEERLARGAIVRNPARTALTVGALSVGLSMVVAVGAVAQSDRRAAADWLAEVVPGDLLLTSIRPIAAEEGIETELLALPGVQLASPIGRFDLAVGGTRLDAAAVSGSDLLADGRLAFLAGDPRASLIDLDGTGSAILPASLATRLGVGVGDSLPALSADGSQVGLRVAAIVKRTIPGRTGETVLVGWRDATARFGLLGADAYAVRFAPGQAATARPLVEAAARQLALEPRPLDAALGAVSDTLDRLFSVFDLLAAIAVVVAGLGIVNTLTMNVLERVREIGVLRAAGMTRRQIWRMVVVEAGVIGLTGAVLGVLLGLAVAAFMLVLAGGVSLVGSLDPPLVLMGFTLVLGVAIAMLAAYYPARVASRMSIVRAVQFE